MKLSTCFGATSGKNFNFTGIDLFSMQTEETKEEFIPNTKFSNPLKQIYYNYIVRLDPYSIKSVKRLLKKYENNVNIIQQGAFPIINHEQYAATILATGSEVEIACQSAIILAKEKINIRVVSFPSWEIFEKQTDEDKLNILGNKPRFAIEAGVINGWEKYIPGENFIGMEEFGASGPYKKLYEHFAITSNALVELVKAKMEKN